MSIDQAGWRWCRNCQGLFYALNASPGPCPAGAGWVHDPSDSANYVMIPDGSDYSDEVGWQDGWYWCKNCQGLFYALNNHGVCPAGTGQSHDPAGSMNYIMQAEDPHNFGQPGWRWCRNCQGLFYALNASHGPCPAGAGWVHDPGGSGSYVVPYEINLDFTMQKQQQSNWCWAAVGASVALYFDPNCNVAQCDVANAQLGRSDCCIDGSTAQCNVYGFLNKALAEVGHFDQMFSNETNVDEIGNQIFCGHPVGIRVAWSGGGAHFLAIIGPNIYTDFFHVDDPIYGPSTVTFEALTGGAYQGSGTWTNTYFTK